MLCSCFGGTQDKDAATWHAPEYLIGKSAVAIHSSRWKAAIGCSEVAMRYFSSTDLSSDFSLPFPRTWRTERQSNTPFLEHGGRKKKKNCADIAKLGALNSSHNVPCKAPRQTG